MGWAIKLRDQTVKLDDLPLSDIELIAAKHNVGPLNLILYPATDVEAFIELVNFVADKVGQPHPKWPADPDNLTAGEYKRVLGLIESVEDDLPVEWEDGVPLDAASVPATTG